jgi:heterodisulfide reductase subunit A
MAEQTTQEYQALVLGGGIAGMQAALDLADRGHRVALVEKGPSIGGQMIRLSKVFPTLDCASCITTPKMAQVSHHPNVDVYALTELEELAGRGGEFTARLRQQPRYVDVDKCIGCLKCEQTCPVMAPSREQEALGARKAIYLPISNAVPQVPRLEVADCILCGRCAKVCPTDAVDYFEKERELELAVEAVVMATGYGLLTDYPERVYGEHADQPNLIGPLAMERILAPTGPYPHLMRPSDGKVPEDIAFVQCAGSRDTQNGVPWCSRVCCMYNIKQASLIAREHPEIELTVYYLDVRCFGKGYERFYRNAKELGVNFVKARAVVWGRGEKDRVLVRYEAQEHGGGPREVEHDLAVLSLAMVPGWSPRGVAPVAEAEDGFLDPADPKLSPTLTTTEGVFMAGAAAGPKDIVDTVVEAGAAASEAAIYLEALRLRREHAA